MRDRWLLLAPARVHEQAAHCVAALAYGLSRDADLDPWLSERVDGAIDMLVRRDGEAVNDRAPGASLGPAVQASAAYLATLLSTDPETAFEAATRFNHLPARTRETYVRLLVENRSIAECLELGLGPLEDLRDRALRAVNYLLGKAHHG